SPGGQDVDEAGLALDVVAAGPHDAEAFDVPPRVLGVVQPGPQRGAVLGGGRLDGGVAVVGHPATVGGLSRRPGRRRGSRRRRRRPRPPAGCGTTPGRGSPRPRAAARPRRGPGPRPAASAPPGRRRWAGARPRWPGTT